MPSTFNPFKEHLDWIDTGLPEFTEGNRPYFILAEDAQTIENMFLNGKPIDEIYTTLSECFIMLGSNNSVI